MQGVERVARAIADVERVKAAMRAALTDPAFEGEAETVMAQAAMRETRLIDAEALRVFADHIPLAGGCFLALDDMTVAAMAGWLKGRADEQ